MGNLRIYQNFANSLMKLMQVNFRLPQSSDSSMSGAH